MAAWDNEQFWNYTLYSGIQGINSMFVGICFLDGTILPSLMIMLELLLHFTRYLPKVFERYSGADGFVFLQDHMILNYWNLMQADKEKLWITNKVSMLSLLCFPSYL